MYSPEVAQTTHPGRPVIRIEENIAASTSTREERMYPQWLPTTPEPTRAMPLELPPKAEAVHPLLSTVTCMSKCVGRRQKIYSPIARRWTQGLDRGSPAPRVVRRRVKLLEASTPQVLDTVSTNRRDSHLPPPSSGYATLAIDSCCIQMSVEGH